MRRVTPYAVNLILQITIPVSAGLAGGFSSGHVPRLDALAAVSLVVRWLCCGLVLNSTSCSSLGIGVGGSRGVGP
jgi:hypothetical protein